MYSTVHAPISWLMSLGFTCHKRTAFGGGATNGYVKFVRRLFEGLHETCALVGG